MCRGGKIMAVYGGLEYTEGLTTALYSYPGGAPGAPVAPVHVAMIGGTQIGFYNVTEDNLDGWAGASRDTNHLLLQNGRVRLTNDVYSAEWVIEGHNAPGPGLSVAQMLQNMTQDIATLYALRQQLADAVAAQQAAHADDTIILAPGAIVDFGNPGADGLFQYVPNIQAQGVVQITVQYVNADTIRRISQLNASKYLTGSKIAEGEDAAQAAGSPSLAQRARDFAGTSSFATAQAVLQALTAAAAPIVVHGVTELTAAQVGLIKLMVLNDAMATTMTRYAIHEGQAQDKNIQRFFPKAQRQTYVSAVAQANVSAAALAVLRVQLTGAAAAMAQLEWNNADPFALRVDETVNELAAAPVTAATAIAIASTRVRNSLGGQVMPFELAGIKNAVLGVNGATLAARIGSAALAYTDTTGAAADHFNVAGNGNVITSARFTPLAGGIRGAIYEFREREVAMAANSTAAVLAALTTLFNAA
jgi:hypothetical protein